MSTTKGKRESSNQIQNSGLLKSLLRSQNISILTFDATGEITNYSEGVSNIFEAPDNFYLNKNLNDLPLSKSEKSLKILDFKNGFTPSRKIRDVKVITSQNRIFSVDINVELSFSKEKFDGGVIHFEQRNDKISGLGVHSNLLSKSKFYLKEPLRIANHFAKKLNQEICEEDIVQREYTRFVQNNIASLECIIEHLLILENLDIHSLDLKQINYEELVLMEVHNNRNLEIDFSINQLPIELFCDRNLIRLLLKLSVDITNNYPIPNTKSLVLDGKQKKDGTSLIFKMDEVSFLDHPSFSIDRPLNRIVKFNTPKASGYELVIINQIVKLHKGELKIFNNKQNETQIEIYLPAKK